jgi:hypothetical protein
MAGILAFMQTIVLFWNFTTIFHCYYVQSIALIVITFADDVKSNLTLVKPIVCRYSLGFVK